MTNQRDRFSLIGHAELPLMSPLREEELVTLLDAAGLASGDRVLDLGGGRGDLSRIAVGRWGCVATSVDRSEAACTIARERTRGLAVEVRAEDARQHLERVSPGLALACAVGAVHAFGDAAAGWHAAEEALARVARRILLADLVALGPAAMEAFEVATLDAIDPGARAVRRLVLGPERVSEYEHAWCASLERWVAAHEHDARTSWARSRIAWTRDPSLRRARGELAFVAFVL